MVGDIDMSADNRPLCEYFFALQKLLVNMRRIANIANMIRTKKYAI